MSSVDTAVHRSAPDPAPPKPFLARREHFATTTSTNDVVANWLAEGTPEVALATADRQTRGRGRDGRSWQADAGATLLLSLGFRPTWLPADRTWLLATATSLAMADAAEEVAGLADGTVRLKWPNDLVIEGPFDDRQVAEHSLRKLAGVLGETTGLGTDDPRAVVGIGINVDWRRADFPGDLAATMTSLHDASGGRAVDRQRLLDTFLVRLEDYLAALRHGDGTPTVWEERQTTTGRDVDLVLAGDERRTVRAIGVDTDSGGLVVEERGRTRIVHSGEIVHVRLAGM